MRQKSKVVLVGVFALVLTLPLAVIADQVFHSQRLTFLLTPAGAGAGHPELRSGHVVDIHPNGPVNGALERYMINGARSETTYQVILRVFQGGCKGTFLFPLQTTTLTTNKQGNAQGKAAFTPQDLAPFAGQVFGIQWTLVDEGGVAAYETICIAVAVD